MTALVIILAALIVGFIFSDMQQNKIINLLEHKNSTLEAIVKVQESKIKELQLSPEERERDRQWKKALAKNFILALADAAYKTYKMNKL